MLESRAIFNNVMENVAVLFVVIGEVDLVHEVRYHGYILLFQSLRQLRLHLLNIILHNFITIMDTGSAFSDVFSLFCEDCGQLLVLIE